MHYVYFSYYYLIPVLYNSNFTNDEKVDIGMQKVCYNGIYTWAI